MQLSPYLVFSGRCREAFEFYQECLGGEITAMMTYAEMPGVTGPEPWAREGILHATLAFDGQTLMGSDGPTDGTPSSTHLSVETGDMERAEQLFAKLSEGGSVRMPMQETFWAQRFGMCSDRFGVPWMVNAAKPMGA